MNSRHAMPAIHKAAERIAVWVIYPVKRRKWGSAENGATQFPVNVAKMEGAKFTSFAKLNKKVKTQKHNNISNMFFTIPVLLLF